MDKRKLLKRIFRAANFLAFIVLIGLVIIQHQQIKKLSKGSSEQSSRYGESQVSQSANPEISGQETAQIMKNGTVSDGAGVETLIYQLQATEEELEMAQEDLNKELDRQVELARLRKEFNKQMEEELSLDMQKNMREMYESQYADFFEAFNISPEDAKAYVDIIVSYSSASQEIYSEAQEVTNPTEADRARFKQLWSDLNAERETKQKDLLGEDVYQEIRPFMIRRSSEEYWNNFSVILDSDEKLTDTQKTALVDALAEAQEKRARESEAEYEESQNTYIFPSERSYDQDYIDEMVENNRRAKEVYIEAARGILSPSQTEKLGAKIEQELDRMIISMKMMALENGYEYEPEGETDAQE